ncbi:MAG: hypothetical protein ACO3EG_06145 [Chitinophagaceae bacterium]
MDPNFVYPAIFKNQNYSLPYTPASGSIGLFASGSKFYVLTTGGAVSGLIDASQTGSFGGGGGGDTGYLTGYVSKTETGQFYPTSNPSGYVTGDVVRPSETGNIGIGTVTLSLDGGGSAITTGPKAFTTVNYNGTIDSYTLIADQIGTLVIDVWKDSYANYPPTDADSITNGNEPHLTSAIKYTEATTGWSSTSISAGDVLYFNVDAASTIEKATLTLKIIKN